MADFNNPHDKFFRASMQNPPIAQAFFQQYLPTTLLDALDVNSFKLEDSSYIDAQLQETFSDLVFSCHYNENVDKPQANLVLLVEHQSTADRLMAFRVFHYLFNMLYRIYKERPQNSKKDKLPPVYALVFYHGKQSPYPFSLKLQDCFDDPLKLMEDVLTQPVPLIDVNEFDDDALKQQQLLGIMTGAIKHSRDRSIDGYLMSLLNNLNSMDLEGSLALNFVKSVLNYLLVVGNVTDVQQFVANAKQLPQPVKGEIMTAAEQLIALGREEGLEKGLEKGREENRTEVAINLLKEDAEPKFVARITGLDLTVVEKLKTSLLD